MEYYVEHNGKWQPCVITEPNVRSSGYSGHMVRVDGVIKWVYCEQIVSPHQIVSGIEYLQTKLNSLLKYDFIDDIMIKQNDNTITLTPGYEIESIDFSLKDRR